MKAINKPGDNLGGLLKMWAVPVSAHSISGSTVTFSDTSDIYEIYCTPETMQFREPKQRTDAGTHYNTSITGFIPRDSETILEAINDMERKPYVVIFRDGNGSYKLAGTKTEPLRINPDLDTGRQPTDPAGYQIEFTGKTLSRAVFIDNPF